MMGGTTHWLRSLWRILGGRRLAVILLVALLLASLLASLFPQLPTDPTSREVWLEAVTLRYGAVTSLLRTLGLFDAYHSPWFLALLAALLVNTAVCTVQRLPRLWRTLTEPPIIARSEAFYQSLAHRAEWMVASRREGLAAAQDTLRQRRYRTHLENDQAAGWASLYGERGRWSQAGTLVSHLAGALLVICVAARPALSWQERGVTLLPKQVYPIGHGYDLALRAGRLGPERSLDKAPLAILADAAVVITETARINQPFTYQGVAFHLQGYGPAAQISTPEGTLSVAFSGSQAQEVTLPNAGLTLRVAYRAERETLFVEALAADGALLGSGSIAPGQEIKVEETPVTFHLTNYTVWQVSRDPTFGLAVGSAILLLVGAAISLWVPHRRLWLRMDDQKAQMVGAGDWMDGFDTIADQIARACPPQEEIDG